MNEVGKRNMRASEMLPGIYAVRMARDRFTPSTELES